LDVDRVNNGVLGAASCVGVLGGEFYVMEYRNRVEGEAEVLRASFNLSV
jgi:hypothetical protein